LKRLHQSILILLVFFAFLLNADSLTQMGGLTSTKLHPFIIVIIPLFVLLIMAIPLLQKTKPVILIGMGLVCYLITYWATRSVTPSFPNDFYLSFSEIIILSIAVFLASRLNQEYIKMHYSIESVILPKHGHRTYDDPEMARRIIEHEFIRGRRYNHPITALVIEPNQDTIQEDSIYQQAILEIQQTLHEHYVTNKLTQVIERETRLTDLVVEWDKQGRFVIVCPETTAEASGKLIERLQSAIKDSLGISILYGIASFPNDARTFDAVLEKAESQLSPQSDLYLQYQEHTDKTAVQKV